MEKASKIVISFFVIAVLILVATFSAIVLFNPSSEKPVEEKVVLEEDEKDSFLYKVSWIEETEKIGYDMIKKNLTRTRLFWDKNMLNGLIDGTLSFRYDFKIGKKHISNVKVRVSWNDRFRGLLGFKGDTLELSVCGPLGEETGSIKGVPLRSKFFRGRVLKIGDPTVFVSDMALNECPPDIELVANSSEDALDKYWDEYDILSYTTGHDSDWMVRGESYTKERRFFSKLRNNVKNLLLGFASDPLSIEISYTYYVMNVEQLETL